MKSIALCALLTPVVAGGGLALWPQAPINAMPSPSIKQAAVVALAAVAATNNSAPAAPARPEAVDPAHPQSMDLHTAVQREKLTGDFRGNGREKMRAILTNNTGANITVRVPAGQMFEAGSNVVIVVRAGEVEVKPGKPVEVSIQTAATRSGNKVVDAPYQLSFGALPRLDSLLAYAQERPEITAGALQTAVLALVENLPLSSVSKFTAAGGDLQTRFDTSAFKVDTGDILGALTTLRAIGTRDSDLAITIDPQLKVEGMIEPSTRSAAMRYYGITPETEWEYWKTELLSGEPSTRHYALYGIARFYPEVALEMLPKWAREAKTQNVLRISAIQALADTQRPEALPILQRLTDELGASTELGRTAAGAAKHLSAHLAKLAANRTTVVAFRGSAGVTQF
jgi:hypothetical protein